MQNTVQLWHGYTSFQMPSVTDATALHIFMNHMGQHQFAISAHWKTKIKEPHYEL